MFIEYISFRLLSGFFPLLTWEGWKSFWFGGFDLFNFAFYCAVKKNEHSLLACVPECYPLVQNVWGFHIYCTSPLTLCQCWCGRMRAAAANNVLSFPISSLRFSSVSQACFLETAYRGERLLDSFLIPESVWKFSWASRAVKSSPEGVAKILQVCRKSVEAQEGTVLFLPSVQQKSL